MKKILFLCTHNSTQSQMAEGLVNHFWKDRYQAFSAGTEPGVVNPNAITIMKEIEIDISNARSKSADEFIREPFDLVVTICDKVRQSCPSFPGARDHIHHSVADPSALTGNRGEILSAFRKTRDDIKEWLNKFLPNY